MDKTSLKYKGKRKAKFMRIFWERTYSISVYVGLCVMEAGLASLSLKLHERKREEGFSVKEKSFFSSDWLDWVIFSLEKLANFKKQNQVSTDVHQWKISSSCSFLG